MILITGAAGFIGLNYLKYITKNDSIEDVIVVDKLTYASHKDVYNFGVPVHIVDIANYDELHDVFKSYNITSVINFAAESHVDTSIKDLSLFINSNIIGTINLLKLSVQFGVQKFLQISTDEVFGQVLDGSFTEQSQIAPRNPYSASKASAEHFVNAFHNTYKLPTLIVNCSNNYGPHQYNEKLIPLTITNLMSGKNVPIYGDGTQIRDWIFVEDACSAIHKVFSHGKIGERYCIGGDNEIKNIDLVKIIIDNLGLTYDRIEYVTDRLGHDVRYYTDCSKLKSELNWEPKWSLHDGIKETIRWYNENRI